jgi:hypothetical protein
VILGGVVTTAYQAAQHVISRRRMTVSIAAMLAAALIAAILVVSR